MTEHPVPGFAAEDDGEPDADTQPTEHVEPVPAVHRDVLDYQRSHAAAHGIGADGGGGGLSVGGPGKLLTNDTLPEDSNQTAGGRPVA